MRCDIPKFTRCCCFVPLRYGILIFGYLNLATAISLLVLESWFGDSPLWHITSHYSGTAMLVWWLPHIFYALEVVFDVVLLVGAHMKLPRLMRIFYNYGILTTVATFISFVAWQVNMDEDSYYWTSVEYVMAFTGFVLQVYLLLLIRTELQKLKEQQKGQSYENHMAEVGLDPPLFGDGTNDI